MGKYQKNIEAARRITVMQYLETYHPGELVRKTDREYCTRTHDSLIITPANGFFHWFSRNVGGNNAIDYLTKVEGMKEINLREFYPWYMEDVMVEVTEEVAEELLAGQRYIKASRRRIYRNKAHYSLDAEDGIEYSACFSNPSPQELIERMERFEHICHALNSLPDAQGQRVFERYLLNHSVKAIAAAEGVTERAINAAIQRGLENMKKYLEKVL